MAAKSASPAAAQILSEIGFNDFPDDWAIVRIEDLLCDNYGISVGVMYPGEHDPDGVPLIKAGDLSGSRINPNPGFRITPDKHFEHRRTELAGSELLISLVGDVGRCALVPPSMAGWNAARAVAVLRFQRPTDAAFIRACLMSPSFQHLMQAWSTTTVQATLNLKEIRQIPLPWPSTKHRDAIAHILGSLDDKIELLRGMNETLESMARALFKDWFVDFGPVRARIEGREPYLAREVWDLFPERLDEEGKPEGWRAGTLAEFASLNPESWSKKNAPAVIDYVDLANTKWGAIESTARMLWGQAPSRAQRILRPGDTIIGTVRPGNGSYTLVDVDGFTGSTGFAVLRPTAGTHREFVYLAASSPDNIERLAHLADGAAYPAVRPEVVLASPVVVPAGNPLPKIMKAFSDAVVGMIDGIEEHKRESRTLAAMRDTLLPKLISGELRVPDAEKLAGAAL